MTKPLFETFPTPLTLSAKSFEELAAIQTRAVRRLADLHVSLATLGIDGNVAQARLLADTENYPGLVAAQSALASDMGNRWIAISRAAADVVTDTRDELNAWIGKNFHTAQDRGIPGTKARTTSRPARRASARKAA